MKFLSTCIRFLASAAILVVFVFISPSTISAWDSTSGGDHGGADWVISSNQDVGGTHTNVGNFQVESGVTITVIPYDGVNGGEFKVYSQNTNIIGTINANGSGYAGGAPYTKGSGPGGGNAYAGNWGGGGASHAGFGANGSGPGASYVMYGSTLAANTMGSGGGGGSNAAGGRGGGAVYIETGDFSISGTIAANGTVSSSRGGGGSGGSIYLKAETFTGAGSITTNGASCGSDCQGGAGGGGRLKIEFSDTNNLTGTITSNQGATSYSGGTIADRGTVIYINSTTNDLIIKNTQRWSADPSVDGSTLSFRDISIINGSTLILKGYYTTNSDGYGVTINARNITVDSTSYISASGYGYGGATANSTKGSGPGGGNGGSWGGGGASYGGTGGGGNGAAASSVIYGSANYPLDLGSGGGAGTQGAGGSGGGAVKLSVSDTLDLAGSIQSRGNSGTVRGAGGSGGSVLLIVNTITGAGSITVKGGGCGSDCQGGPGSGGRVAIWYGQSNSFVGSVDVTKGVGYGSGGSAGTYQTFAFPGTPSSLTQTNIDDTVINTGQAIAATTYKVVTSVSAGGSMNIIPEVEIKEIGTDFTNFPDATGSAVSYIDTPVLATTTITGLVDLASYHWQARSCDASYNCSGWVSYGDNNESDTDLSIFLNQTPNNPIISTSSADIKLINGSYDNDSSPTFNFILSDPDEANTVSYRIQISLDANHTNIIVDYTSSLSSQGAKTFTVGQLELGGTYNTYGYSAQTLEEGNYFWRVMTIDSANGQSSWINASLSTAAFKIDLQNPNSNATSITNATEAEWLKDPPTISWSEGEDQNSGILGYCISLRETDIGAAIDISDPSTDSGVLSSLDDGIDQDNCPYIVSSTTVNTEDISGLSLTTNKQYYFSIKAIDLAGNIYTNPEGDTYSNLLSFKYDGTAPINVNSISGAGGSFSNINDMYFSWPTNQATDSASGLLGFQFAINDQSTWFGTETDSTTQVSFVPVNSTQPFYLDSTRDRNSVIIGDNTIYFRMVDKAGNTSIPATYRTTSIAYGGEAPSFSGDAALTITPSTNTSNSFALSWPSASPSAGRTITKYYYMVNVSPPTTLATIKGNSALYLSTTENSVSATSLPGINRGTNYVYVVPIDDNENYSPSNYLRGTLVLNSENPDPPTNLAVTDASLKASSLWRGSLVWGDPEYKGTGSLSYLVQRSDDGLAWANIASTSGTAYVDTVPLSKKYYWRVASMDSSDISKASPSFANAVTVTPKGSYTTPPDLSSGPSVSGITTKKAKISWSTSRTSDSKVAYGIESGKYNEVEASSSLHVTDHVINLTNLSPGVTYYYITKWTDEDGNNGVSQEKTFSTSPAPTAKDISVTNIGLDTALIKFTAIGASKAKIYYGTTTSFGAYSEMSTATDESAYSLLLSGLEDGKKYYYKINLMDTEGDEYDNITLDFTTLPRPKISSVQIQQVSNTAQTTLYVTWNSNTEISSIVSYYPSGRPEMIRDEVNVNMVKDRHEIILRGLLPDTSYLMTVKGRDKIGNEATSDQISFTTATDTRPPEIYEMRTEPGEVTQNSNNSESTTQMIVSWNTDEPSTSQVEFGEGTGADYPQKTQEDSNLTLNHMVIISNLSPSKVYHLRAISKDKADNTGRSLDTVTITPKLTDSAVDLVISNLQDAFGFITIIK